MNIAAVGIVAMLLVPPAQDVGEWVAVAAEEHVPAPDAERIEGLIDNYWGYVRRVCTELAENVERCIPPQPTAVNIYVVPFEDFMQRWMGNETLQRRIHGDEFVDAVLSRKIMIYGFTASEDGYTFEMYFYENPTDFMLAHEITHVMEVMRRERPDEDRTVYRQADYLSSQHYTEWLRVNY